MQKTSRKYISHMKFEVICMRYLWRPFWICAFCAFPAPPRLCSWISVEMIPTGQPLTAAHVCFPEKW